MICDCHRSDCCEGYPGRVPDQYDCVSAERAERLADAARRQGEGYLRFLRRCKRDPDINAWYYDPLRALTPEEIDEL